jgi:hypothetical protein
LGCCFCCRPSYLITIRSIPAHHNLLLSPPVSQMTELWSRFDESKKVNPFLHPWRYKNKFNWCWRIDPIWNWENLRIPEKFFDSARVHFTDVKYRIGNDAFGHFLF